MLQLAFLPVNKYDFYTIMLTAITAKLTNHFVSPTRNFDSTIDLGRLIFDSEES